MIKTHFPVKQIKYNKHKHKGSEWITNGIIRSIKFRDKLYKQMITVPSDTHEYFIHKTNLHTYNKMLKKTIRQAKSSYYIKKFRKYRQDIHNTWVTINNALNRNRKDKFPQAFNIHNQWIMHWS